MTKYTEIGDLIGKVLDSIEANHQEIVFNTRDGKKYRMCHLQDCCEDVTLEDVNGDFDDLIGSPILTAKEVGGYEPVEPEDIDKTREAESWGSCTWTFYKIATVKGYVTIRWFGVSNGYYSESVDLIEIE